MGFLPKDYVWVHTRVQKFHDTYEQGQITTEFTTVWDIISFQATVVLDVTVPLEQRRLFTWSSLWDVHKEKAFEKLETVAVGRALAFAWFDIKDWIASNDEMQRFQANSWRDLWDIMEDIKKEKDLDKLVKLKDEAKTVAKSDKQKNWLERDYKTAYQKLVKTSPTTDSNEKEKEDLPF